MDVQTSTSFYLAAIPSYYDQLSPEGKIHNCILAKDLERLKAELAVLSYNSLQGKAYLLELAFPSSPTRIDVAISRLLIRHSPIMVLEFKRDNHTFLQKLVFQLKGNAQDYKDLLSDTLSALFILSPTHKIARRRLKAFYRYHYSPHAKHSAVIIQLLNDLLKQDSFKELFHRYIKPHKKEIPRPAKPTTSTHIPEQSATTSTTLVTFSYQPILPKIPHTGPLRVLEDLLKNDPDIDPAILIEMLKTYICWGNNDRNIATLLDKTLTQYQHSSIVMNALQIAYTQLETDEPTFTRPRNF